MTRIRLSCLAILVCFSTLQSQDWANEWFSTVFAGGKIKPDSMTALLRIEFGKALGTNAPDFAFKNLDGDRLEKLADYKGQVVVVNFWATNCSGCRYEMPDLSRLQEAYRSKGLRIVFLSSQDKQALLAYFKENKLLGLNGTVERNQLKRPYQMVAMPSSFIVDRKGIVRDTWVGPETFAGAEKRILSYLGEKE